MQERRLLGHVVLCHSHALQVRIFGGEGSVVEVVLIVAFNMDVAQRIPQKVEPPDIAIQVSLYGLQIVGGEPGGGRVPIEMEIHVAGSKGLSVIQEFCKVEVRGGHLAVEGEFTTV